MQDPIVLISDDDDSDQEVLIVGPSKPSLVLRSSSQPAPRRPSALSAAARAAIVIDSDTDEEGIQTDDETNCEDQDIFGLLASKSPPRPRGSAAKRTSSTGFIGDASTYTAASTSTSIGARGVGVGASLRAAGVGKGKGRSLGETQSMFEGSILSRIGTFDFDDLANNPSSPYVPAQKAKKRHSTGDDAELAKKRPRDNHVLGAQTRDMAVIKAKEKEAKAAERARQKEAKQFERDTIKAAKEAEKSYQKKLSEVNKLRVSKQDAVREVQLYLSSDLQKPSSPIAGALPNIQDRIRDNQSSLHFLPEPDSPIPGVIRFKRHLQARWDHIGKRFVPLDEARWVWETTVLVIITAEELVDKIADGDEVLMQWASDVRLLLGMSATDQVVVMIKGLQRYYSRSRSLAQKDYQNAARAGLGEKSGGGGSSMNARHTSRPTKERIEDEMVKLQVAQRCFLVHVEKTEDIEDWVFNIAADVAIRPYKLISKSHLNFAPAEGQKKALQPSALLELMLQEIQGITPSAAAGIVDVYPTFKRLMEAFDMEERRGLTRAENMLQFCEIRSLRSGHESGRKLNKALSKRVYNVLRGKDSLSLA